METQKTNTRENKEGLVGKVLKTIGKVAVFPVAGFLPNYVQRHIYGENALPFLASGLSILTQFYLGNEMMSSEDGRTAFLGGLYVFQPLFRSILMGAFTTIDAGDGVVEGGSVGSIEGIIPGEILGRYMLRREYKKNPEEINKRIDDCYHREDGIGPYTPERRIYSKLRIKRDKRLAKEKRREELKKIPKQTYFGMPISYPDETYSEWISQMKK